MKIVLILMVRNESKILERCLQSVEGVVDAFCVHDTGSTDATVEIAKEFVKTRKGCVTESVWQNFGHNRTLSFQAARDYVRDALKWKLEDTYGLLLDADMVFFSGTLKQQSLTEIGYSIVQKNGNLEYPNCRLVRMDYEWVCRGVTHEYWDGTTKGLSKAVCHIDDRNDGGCKSDKFERDARLLEDGLAKEPENARYMFYLAQTYHSLGRWEDSKAMYKKRFKAGGWFEEQWYSLYMMAQCYLSLKDPIKFEAYMQRAYEFRPQRAEALYKLAKYFREKGENYKAYHYIQKGKSIPFPTDSLFIEKDVYDGLFDYESTICMYYTGGKSQGLRASMEYLLTRQYNLQNVYQNMIFYVEPIGLTMKNHPVLRDIAGLDYHPSSVSVFQKDGKTYHNVRFVNYSINQKNGGYDMKDGAYSGNNAVRTQNVCWVDSDDYRLMNDSTVTLPRKPSNILGLEDVRVYTNASNEIKFMATTREYSDKNRIVYGSYGLDGSYSDCQLIDSPYGAECEKNWIPIDGTDDILYRWHPLEVGSIKFGHFLSSTKHETPWFFQHLRGSAVPVRLGDELWALAHYVEYSQPRKYFHCMVVLDGKTYKPKRMSLPFVFRSTGIEYCLGVQYEDGIFEFIFSSWDDNPCIMSVPTDYFEWIQV